ncbi:hypothetical protein GCM10020219_023300 [Nonomuraea dietziae]
MDIDGFWALIERSERETDTKRERVAWLEEHLFGLSVEEIVDFDVFWTIAPTGPVRGTCTRFTGTCSAATPPTASSTS